MKIGLRWLKFNAVGGIGIGVQLAALVLFREVFHWGVLWATAAAVEVAVLHNFAWHVRWTWRDRPGGARLTLARAVRFNLTTGLVSIVSNVVFMRIFVGAWKLPYVAANLGAIAVTAVVNFLASEFLVFREKTERG